MAELKIRPHPTQHISQKDGAKAFIHRDVYVNLGFTAGRLCIIEANCNRLEAVAWPSQKDIGKTVVQLSETLRKTAGFEMGDTVRIQDGGDIPDANNIGVQETTADDVEPMDQGDLDHWKWAIKGQLKERPHIFSGLELSNMFVNGPRRSFVVETVNESKGKVAKMCKTTRIDLSDESPTQPAGKLEVKRLPGLANQVDQLNFFFTCYDIHEYDELPPEFCGIIIEGSHGTGKSRLLDEIEATHWGKVIHIESVTQASQIGEYCQAAIIQQQPTIILIDDIQDLISKNQSIVKPLKNGLRQLSKDTEKLGKRPKVVIVATCLNYHNDVPHALRSDDCFPQYISLSIPDVAARHDIIQDLKPKFAVENFNQYVSDLSDRTHAYTPGDLRKLIKRARIHFLQRIAPYNEKGAQEYMIWEDVQRALKDVPPTAMHDINLKPPKIHWADICGYSEVKEMLKRIFRSPSGDGPKWVPPKGVLMYGPPGCSKTMIAQAMATELAYNFFSVKGPELFNMYVGETERGIRNLFQRAREASPSIIFFDEIDALVGTRSGSGSYSNGGATVQALTTLLTEMDGFEQRGGIFVLAATNKPDTIDPALLRPGRFDRLVFVGLPDQDARAAIFAKKAKELHFPPSTDTVKLAEATKHFSGAEIAELCDRAFDSVLGDVSNGTEVLLNTIKGTEPRVTEDMLHQFKKWQKA